jgi:nicotinamide-nucleotide amidase
VAYDDSLKTSLLGVDDETLRAHGAVSEEVARAMASGARQRLGTDLALASTGIAGPTGARPEKPVGLVYLALSTPSEVHLRRLTLPGARDEIRRRSVIVALNLLWRQLDEEEFAAPRATLS